MKILALSSLFFVKFLAGIHPSDGLSCFNGAAPCEIPKCCDSGFLVPNACGECKTCGKALNQTCGGPWMTSGMCAKGLSCLKKCEPWTRCEEYVLDRGSKKNCQFPFNYKGRTFYECTTFNSANGKPWCALSVDTNDNVVDNEWADCECKQQPCDSTDFFNANGRCINPLQRGATNTFQYQLEDGATDVTPILKCSSGVNPRQCLCAPPQNEEQMQDYCREEGGWCFLLNVQDHTNPAKDCYDDVQYSPTYGMFWSNMACKG